ncbi:MAG: ATP-binding cassette domain-containing protein [Roseburia sp.]|nr:ATP-binding cassette domain-containing protein [Roseburia sp.]MCM1278798.1 ATP-binding cassette domain-containing protein [Robinsoniella sp.]
MESLLKVENLRKVYGKNISLDGLNMNINRGEIYGLVGNNGAGKTTLMRIIMGLAKETSGSFSLFGEKNGSISIENRKKVSAIIEMPAFYPHLTGYQNLKIHQMEINENVDKKKLMEILKKVNIDDAAHKKVKAYSLGMRQRLGIAKALVSNAEFIILDEPTNGLDPAGIIELRNLILDLNKNKGTTFLIASHHIAELTHLISKLGIIKAGKMVQEIKYDELKNSTENIEQHIMNLA